ncbi:MAG: response regulator [Elusimicrobia bacterium]|nr:response regulator [Elusimicrobiota bacterium]
MISQAPPFMATARRILLVEDDPGYQELGETILGGLFELTVCSSVEDALERIAGGRRYDLIISDIHLFGVSGLELLGRLKEAGAGSCPIIICSSQSDPATRQSAMALGAAGFIAKPYDFEAVVALVRKLLPGPGPA